MNMNNIYKLGLVCSIIGIIFTIIGFAIDTTSLWHSGLALFAVGFAIGSGYWSSLKNYQFTLWIAAGFVLAMIYSKDLIIWGGFNITHKWIVAFVVQATMFSMGTQLSINDFVGVAKMPKAVFSGALCQFTIMPLIGYSLTLIFDFPPEIAMGIILIGSCASGLSSNVMAYIANANLALSVSVTALCTLLSALATPIWIKVLGDSLVAVNFFAMMASVIQIVIVPIGAAILHDYIKNYASVQSINMIKGLAVVSLCWALYMFFGGWDALFANASQGLKITGTLSIYFALGIVWSLIYTWLTDLIPKVKQVMPAVSMVGIIFFTTTAAASGRDNLMQVGVLLIVAMMIHNIGGYILGYVVSRYLFRVDEQAARTIAIEVGLQNGGMASGLAASMGKLATIGLAAAVVTPIGNISGSILANYWRKKDLRAQQSTPDDIAKTIPATE